MATYLYIHDIKGSVTASNHKDWIEISSFSFQMNRYINTLPGQIYDRESSRPSISEIEISKKIDNSSVLLFQQSCTGKVISNITIDLCQTNQHTNAYAQIQLYNIIISKYALFFENRDNNTRPVENISLSFDKIEYRYTPYNRDNQAQSPLTSGYDLKNASII